MLDIPTETARKAWDLLTNVYDGYGNLLVSGELLADGDKPSREVQHQIKAIRKRLGQIKYQHIPVATDGISWSEVKALGPHLVSLVISDEAGNDILSATDGGATYEALVFDQSSVRHLQASLLAIGVPVKSWDVINLDECAWDLSTNPPNPPC